MPCACCLGWTVGEWLVWHAVDPLQSDGIRAWSSGGWYFFCDDCRRRAAARLELSALVRSIAASHHEPWSHDAIIQELCREWQFVPVPAVPVAHTAQVPQRVPTTPLRLRSRSRPGQRRPRTPER